MAVNAPRAWLIAYDIRDARRLSRFHRFITKHAQPVQYSVYFFEGSAAQLGRLAREIEARIDCRCDDVRIYQLPAQLQCTTLGRGSLPQHGWLLSDQGSGLGTLTRGAGGC